MKPHHPLYVGKHILGLTHTEVERDNLCYCLDKLTEEYIGKKRDDIYKKRRFKLMRRKRVLEQRITLNIDQ